MIAISSVNAIQKGHVITEITLGNLKTKNKLDVYISPSCLHCGKFISEDLEEFVKKHSDDVKVSIKFLPTSAKDIFIMKLLQNEAQDEISYFTIYKKYIKRAIATINFVKPTEKQKTLFIGSNKDPGMIKFQVIASEFGFSDEKILKAFPDPMMVKPFESAVMRVYSDRVNIISKVTNTKQLDLPLIIKNEKIFKNLDDTLKK